MHPYYIIELLNKRHDYETFSCGIQELDAYLQERASQEVKKKITAVYVIYEKNAGRIAGFYTLSSYSIELAELPPKIAKKFPKYPLLPATLLGRLAVDRKCQGRGIGEKLVLDALIRSYELSKRIGSMAIVVEAKNEKVRRFYERYGFKRFAAHQLKLYLPMGTVKKLVDD